jgi:hypothetical protein
MALVSILLLAVVSGSLFFKRTLATWKERDSLAEELAYVHGELTSAIQSGEQIVLGDSSMIVWLPGKEATEYRWYYGEFSVNGKTLLTKGATVERLSIETVSLPDPALDTILNENDVQPTPGLYRLSLTLADSRGLRDSLKCLVVNRYEQNKFRDN